MSLEGETAYITGGASGIARAVTTMLVSKGAKVFIADRDFKGAEAFAKELNKNGQVAWAVEVDVADWESQLKGFEAAVKELNRIDYVYPIAGIGERSWLPNRPNATGFTKPDLTVMDVDANGVLYTAGLALQQFRRQEPSKHGFRGKIVAVASVCGIYYVPSLPVYTAAKHAVVGFVRSFGKYLPEENITLNAVCPNIIRTNISTGEFYGKAKAQGLLVPMENLVAAFESLQGDSKVSGECLEIPPAFESKYRIVPAIPYANKESEVSVDITSQRSHRFHEPVKE